MAPQLRKKNAEDKDGFGDLGNDGDLDCDLLDTEYEDAKLHDADTLPHSYCADDINHLFPIIHAADPEYDLLDWNPEDVYYGPEFVSMLGADYYIPTTTASSADATSTTTPTASTTTVPARSAAGTAVGELRARTPAPAPEADADVGEHRDSRGGGHATGALHAATRVATCVGEFVDDSAYEEARGRRAVRDATPVAPRVGELPCRQTPADVASDASAFRQSRDDAEVHRRQQRRVRFRE